MTAAVVSAVYGDFDTVRPQAEQDIAVDWVCFTDSAELVAPEPWVTVLEPLLYDHPCLAAKVHKCVPALEHPDIIWIDANMEVTASSFAREALAARHDGVATFRHPRRDCIYDEAEASLGSEGQNGKYAGLPITEQVQHYRAQGHPEHGGLFACGVVAWDHSDPFTFQIGGDWLSECERWTYQDQLSFPVVARRWNIQPGVFPFPQIEARGRRWLENRWLRIHPHLR